MLRTAVGLTLGAAAVVMAAASDARAQAGAWNRGTGDQLAFSFHFTGQGFIHGEDNNIQSGTSDEEISKLWSPGFGLRLEMAGRMVRGISGHLSIGYIEHRGDEDFLVGPPFTAGTTSERYHRLQQVPLLIGIGIHPFDFSGQRIFDLYPRVDVGVAWTSDVDIRVDTVPGSTEDLEVYRPTTQLFVGVGGGITLRLGQSPWFVGAELTYRLYSRLRGARFQPGINFRSTSAIGALQGGFYIGVWV